MKIAILNDVHVGKDLVKDDVVRAASSRALNGLETVLSLIQKHNPDLIIDLGDLIRSDSVEADKKNYTQAIKLFSSIQTPTIHLLGNHELKQLSAQEISSIWQNHAISQDFFGLSEVNGIQYIWLDFEQEKTPHGVTTKLSTQNLKKLDELLNANHKPTIILSHYILTEQNLDGNFLFQKPLNVFADYSNASEILAVLKKHSHVLAVFSAHTHALHFKVVDQLPHITLPAMVENIAAPHTNDNFPEIYSIVTIENRTMNIKCFSGEYCFATLELDSWRQ